MNHLKEWLLKKLEEKNMSVAKLSFETGLSRSIIYYYMEDVNRPTRNNLEKICSVLDADINEALALFTPKKIGRPQGSVKRWGQTEDEKLLLKNINDINPLESTSSPEFIDI